jgi:SdrD B-like domain
MSPVRRPRFTLETLDERVVPAATVLDLTTVGAEVTAPSGALVSQYDDPAPAVGTTHTVVQLQMAGPGGTKPPDGTEQGYNTNARPVQYNEVSAPQLNRALTLGEIPVVTIGGVAYRQILLNINQTMNAPYLSLDELRVFVGNTGTLTGYNPATHRLSGQSAVFDLDSGGDVSVKLNANLNAGTSAPDAVVLIPDVAFTGANASTFVYLYSKFSGANGGFEAWAVADVPSVPPPPPPPPPPAVASLAGSLYVDANHDGVQDNGETGLGGVTVTLQGFDVNNNPVSLETVTANDGSYGFTNVPVGTYTLTEQPLFGYASGTSVAGTDGGTAGTGQISNITLQAGDTATGYLFGDVFSE